MEYIRLFLNYITTNVDDFISNVVISEHPLHPIYSGYLDYTFRNILTMYGDVVSACALRYGKSVFIQNIMIL